MSTLAILSTHLGMRAVAGDNHYMIADKAALVLRLARKHQKLWAAASSTPSNDALTKTSKQTDKIIKRIKTELKNYRVEVQEFTDPRYSTVRIVHFVGDEAFVTYLP